MTEPPLLSARNLHKTFVRRVGLLRRAGAGVKAVEDVSVDVERGRTVAIVGESGAGKSTVGLLLLRILDPDQGSVQFEGRDILAMDRRALRRWRTEAQMIFQDPYTTLDPRVVVFDSVAEPLIAQGETDKSEVHHRAAAVLDRVGVRPDQFRRYPHEFSGGQLQRIGIARALITGPKLIVCDEPVSALDVSVKAQIINLLVELQQQEAIGYMFVSHDLSVVRHIAHRVVVMLNGHVVEVGDTERLFSAPEHPYTRALLAAIPVADPRRAPKRSSSHRMRVASPTGCQYADRCPVAEQVCEHERPVLVESTTGRGQVRCHLIAPATGTPRTAERDAP